MPRFYLPPEQCQSEPMFLTGREAHHALRVLRLRLGDPVTVLNGAGDEFLCRIAQYDRDKVKLTVTEKRSLPQRAYQITLLQALPKGKIIESIVQKATELGVSRIIPLFSERVVPTQTRKKKAIQKNDKLRLIAVEASKQCGSPWLPQIEPPATPQQFLARAEKFDLPLVASLQSGAAHPRQHFSAYYAQHARKPRSVCVWVGPEGDFAPGEIEAIQAAGALPISLGPLVLRSETAAIYCLSILNYELQASEGAAFPRQS